MRAVRICECFIDPARGGLFVCSRGGDSSVDAYMVSRILNSWYRESVNTQSLAACKAWPRGLDNTSYPLELLRAEDLLSVANALFLLFSR